MYYNMYIYIYIFTTYLPYIYHICSICTTDIFPIHDIGPCVSSTSSHLWLQGLAGTALAQPAPPALRIHIFHQKWGWIRKNTNG